MTTDLEIAALAEDIADTECPELPVDPKIIAEQEGITWSYADYGGAFDGLLACRDGRFHIFCNAARGSSERSPRGRFTFAHELGHYFIDDHRLSLTSGETRPHLSVAEWQSDLLVERQADLFAANLLMPQSRFLARSAHGTPGMQTILNLSETFQVSVTASAVRYLHCCPVPCAVVMWALDGTQRWAWASQRAHRVGLHKLIGKLEAGAADFATSRALLQQVQEEAPYFENVTTASTWFPFVNTGSRTDMFMVEQAVRLGGHGILTVLCERTEL